MGLIRRNVRVVAAGVVVSGILAAALWPEAVEVSTATAARAPMQVTIDEDGETRVRERFVVSAPVAGRLQRIELDPGDAVVARSTVLARIAPAAAPLLDARNRSELVTAVEAARAALGQAQAERMRAVTMLTRLRTALRRQRELAMAGAIAADALDQAEAETGAAEEAMRAAEFAVARGEQEVRLARARLQQPGPGAGAVNVIAPVDGIVLRIRRESESVVPTGEPLVEIGDPTRLEVVADLLSTDAVRVAPGALVLLEQWGGAHPIAGRVRRVEPSGFLKLSALGVEEQRVNVIIDLDRAHAGALGDGYRVEVRIVVWRSDDVLQVPAGSIFRRGEGWAAFIVDGNRARLRDVRIGQRNATDVQILEGLEAGRTVVLHPPDTLDDGARVTPRRE